MYSQKQVVDHYSRRRSQAAEALGWYRTLLAHCRSRLDVHAEAAGDAGVALATELMPALTPIAIERAERLTGFRGLTRADPLKAMARTRASLERTMREIEAEPDWIDREALAGPAGSLRLRRDSVAYELEPLQEECDRFEKLEGFKELVRVRYDSDAFDVGWWEPRYWRYWATGDRICEELDLDDFGDQVMPLYRRAARARDCKKEELDAVDGRIAAVHELVRRRDDAEARIPNLPAEFLAQCRRLLADHLEMADVPLLAEWLERDAPDDRASAMALRRFAGRCAKRDIYRELVEERLPPVVQELVDRERRYERKLAKFSRPKHRGQSFGQRDLDTKFSAKMGKHRRRVEQLRKMLDRVDDYDGYERFDPQNPRQLWWREFTGSRPPAAARGAAQLVRPSSRRAAGARRRVRRRRRRCGGVERGRRRPRARLPAGRRRGLRVVKRLRIVSYAINGRGMGHLVRQLAILRWVRRLTTALGVRVECWVLTSSEADTLARREGVPALKMPSKAMLRDAGIEPTSVLRTARTWVMNTVAGLRPDVLVVDTFPGGSFGELTACLELARARVLVARRVREEFAAEDPYRGLLSLYDEVIAPDEGGSGPVLIREREELLARDDARRALGVADGVPAVYVTLGGGGDVAAAELLPRVVGSLRDRGLHVVVGAGPLYHGTELRGEGVTWMSRYVPFELFAGLDAAVSAGGYNTFHELMHAGVPTVFLPQPRIADDQRRAGPAARSTPAPGGWPTTSSQQVPGAGRRSCSRTRPPTRPRRRWCPRDGARTRCARRSSAGAAARPIRPGDGCARCSPPSSSPLIGADPGRRRRRRRAPRLVERTPAVTDGLASAGAHRASTVRRVVGRARRRHRRRSRRHAVPAF